MNGRELRITPGEIVVSYISGCGLSSAQSGERAQRRSRAIVEPIRCKAGGQVHPRVGAVVRLSEDRSVRPGPVRWFGVRGAHR